MAGLFIAMEGCEGSGKSTQSSLLAEHLRSAGREVITTREPGGSPAAEQVRAILLDPASAGLSDRAEALLFAAARADHVQRTVRPALEAGSDVITDRYLDSSIAYQGMARGLGPDVVEELSLWATEHLVPDLTVVLDIDPAVGLVRAGSPDRLEAEPLEFHQRVRESFLALAQRAPARYLVIPADGDREGIARTIAAAVDALLAERV